MPIIPQFLPELLRPIVAAAGTQIGRTVFYRYGHRDEVVRDLALLDSGKTTKDKKYPLVWLVMDFRETHGKVAQVYAQTTWSLILAVGTQPNYTEEERRDKSFIPVLLPLYGAILDQISQSTTFRMPVASLIDHDSLLRPYWENEGKKNIFNDWCDVIEISNLKLAVRQQIC